MEEAGFGQRGLQSQHTNDALQVLFELQATPELSPSMRIRPI
jgi:hypothetical protein